MTFLIDGYNLMHNAGLASRQMSPARFERARLRFLDWLAEEAGARAEALKVVFDAQQAVGPTAEFDRKGVRVLFAYRQTADDLIEKLIATAAHPPDLYLVSNDGRLREAARRGGCPSRSCEQFTDWLIERQPAPRPTRPARAEKPDGPAPAQEVDELLRAFNKPTKK